MEHYSWNDQSNTSHETIMSPVRNRHMTDSCVTLSTIRSRRRRQRSECTIHCNRYTIQEKAVLRHQFLVTHRKKCRSGTISSQQIMFSLLSVVLLIQSRINRVNIDYYPYVTAMNVVHCVSRTSQYEAIFDTRIRTICTTQQKRRSCTHNNNRHDRQRSRTNRFWSVADDDDNNFDDENDENFESNKEPLHELENGKDIPIIDNCLEHVNNTQQTKPNTNKTLPTTNNQIEKKISIPSSVELQFIQRVIQLEQLVAAQQVQIRQLSNQVKELIQTTESFSSIVSLIREASSSSSSSNKDSSDSESKENPNINTNDNTSPPIKSSTKVTGTFDGDDDARSIFGTAPATVMEAADAAGASILAGILAGKQRMLVDVRDAELSFVPAHSETLVQFIELAILPVAAGLEGLRSRRNRLKVVFPTVSHLLTYRKSMALSAPDVVALSTLGFDPVEQKDNLVVILVPSPDDDEGLLAMNELLSSQSITQPVVVINHHMVPVTGPASAFEVAYHLRLLSVQYMSSDNLSDENYFQNLTDDSVRNMIQASDDALTLTADDLILDTCGSGNDKNFSMDDNNVTNDIDAVETRTSIAGNNISSVSAELLLDDSDVLNSPENKDVTTTLLDPYTEVALDDSGRTIESNNTDLEQMHDDEVEAAMKHAHYVGMHHGSTRAMVIRAYPRAWHVFVDTSPDTDADFEVAAIFADEPNMDQVNHAIIECIEGSELEDELVAQQMQQAFESGQLDRVSELLASMGLDDFDDDDDDDDDDPYMKMFGEDTV